MAAPGAIVIGGYVNGLGLVRALAARGVAVAVVSTQPYDIAHLSRSCVAHDVVLGTEEHPEALVDLLLRRAGERAGWLLLPTNDEALLALALHRDRLAVAYRVAAPSWDVARTLVDKQLMLAAAREAGATPPHCFGPAVAEIVERADLRFPVVVKPRLGYRFVAHFGVKLFVARDRVELRRAVDRLAAAGLEGDVHDLVPGGDDRLYAYCTFVDASGAAHDGVTVRKLRQSHRSTASRGSRASCRRSRSCARRRSRCWTGSASAASPPPSSSTTRATAACASSR